jgi:sulfoxide reductase heme-binding subunit YedZ
MIVGYQLWRDRRGRLSWLRVAALILLILPIALALEAALAGRLAPRLYNDLVHRTGYWALIFLLIALAITPLQRGGRISGLIDARRLIGVGAFLYATAHIGLYLADEKFDLLKVASEVIKRLYLTIGLIAWLAMLPLAATSTDAMVRRLGATRWRWLHGAIYGIATLGLVHFFQQTKADFTLPVTVTGIFVWLLAYRVVAAQRARGELSALALAILTVAVAVLVALGEAVGIALWYRVSPIQVLQTTFDFELAIRPAWYVLLAGLVVAGVAWWRGRAQPKGPSPDSRRRTPAMSRVARHQPQANLET